MASTTVANADKTSTSTSTVTDTPSTPSKGSQILLSRSSTFGALSFRFKRKARHDNDPTETPSLLYRASPEIQDGSTNKISSPWTTSSSSIIKAATKAEITIVPFPLERELTTFNNTSTTNNNNNRSKNTSSTEVDGPTVGETDPSHSPQPQPQLEPEPDLSNLPSLPKPICIPRLFAGKDVPFARAWAPVLSSLHVSKADFLSFLDVLNILTSPHPCVVALKLVAAGASFIPVDYADAIEAALKITAEGVQYAVARARINAFLRKANESYWHARGMHVRVRSTKKMRKMIGIGKKEKLVLPLTEEVVELTTLERCTRGIERWCERLEVDPEGLPMSKVGGKGRGGYLERIAAWRVRWVVKEENKSAKKKRRKVMRRKEMGKKVRGEWGEQGRLRWLDWVVIQRLGDWEREMEEKERKNKEKKEKGLAARVSSWRTVKSEGDEGEVCGAGAGAGGNEDGNRQDDGIIR
ncbi:hypothetical protein MKZ38_008047 [Zalerion maritima]|uniref:Uncharacterized protein n=1 Tax=Zalerion maritima TaxID=339359 RepID=A0AAD5RH32_9PEZI|nr:hypothetical protein MKZ38_008047 [Zalerion maritima]